MTDEKNDRGEGVWQKIVKRLQDRRNGEENEDAVKIVRISDIIEDSKDSDDDKDEPKHLS